MDTTTYDRGDIRCVACGRRADTRLCPPDWQAAVQRLADLPGLYQRLEISQIPTPSGGERISAAPPGSRPAAVVAALSLRTGALGRPVALLPAGWTPEGADVPIPTWVAGWARAWRTRHGHSTRPVLRRVPPPPPPAAAVAATGDPVADGWIARHGPPAALFGLGAACGYLTTWLPHAVDHSTQHPDLQVMLDGLRGLHRRARAVLGERTDDVYLGRCPQTITCPDTGGDTLCGTPLWQYQYASEVVDPTRQDPYAGVIVCRRCRTEWPRQQWLLLAAAIRQVWPRDAPDRRTWDRVS